jgi:uncharacterized protein (TIGR02284 family)
MENSHDKAISVLNGLIETCKNGEIGFRDAAESVKSDHLRTLLGEFSQQRAQFAAQLQAEVARLGGKAEHSGTLAGSLHRGWMNVKAAVTGADDASIISECERGEDIAKAAYRDALEGSALPAELRELVERQSMQVKETHDRVRNLEVRLEK